MGGLELLELGSSAQYFCLHRGMKRLLSMSVKTSPSLQYSHCVEPLRRIKPEKREPQDRQNGFTCWASGEVEAIKQETRLSASELNSDYRAPGKGKLSLGLTEAGSGHQLGEDKRPG